VKQAQDRQAKDVDRFFDHLSRKAADPGLRKGDRTRYRLKAAAVRLLETHDYHQLSMKQVTDDVGVSEGVVYHHFNDKRTLVLETMTELWQWISAPLLGVVRTGDAFSRVYQANLAYVNFVASNTGLWKCLRLLTLEAPEFREFYHRANYGWSLVIARGLQHRTGSGDVEAAMFTAWTLTAMLDEMLSDVYVRKVPEFAELAKDPDRLAEMLSIHWYRLAYAANPESDILAPDHPLLELALDRTPESKKRQG